MNTQTQEALKMAIECGARNMVSRLTAPNGPVIAIQFEFDNNSFEKFVEAIRKEALAQPAQEPVAKQYLVVDENDCHGDGSVYRGLRGKDSSIPTYRIETHPAPAKEPLSEQKLCELADSSWEGLSPHADTMAFARAIEKAHGIGESDNVHSYGS